MAGQSADRGRPVLFANWSQVRAPIEAGLRRHVCHDCFHVFTLVVERLPDITDNRLVFDYFEPNRTRLILVK